MQQTSVLIIGSTGFCGQGTLRTLTGDPSYRVIAHVRPNSRNRESLERACSDLKADVLACSFDEISEHIKRIQPTVVCSFIGTTKKKMKQLNQTYDDIDYGINQTLIDATQQLDFKPLFVYVSSMGIEWAKWSAYLMARQKVEQALASSKLPHVILRPGLLSGPTRTESRPMEHYSAIVSKSMGQLAQRLGWQKKAHEWMPLKAPQIGLIVRTVIEEWSTKQHPMIATTMLVHEMHALLDTHSAPSQ